MKSRETQVSKKRKYVNRDDSIRTFGGTIFTHPGVMAIKIPAGQMAKRLTNHHCEDYDSQIRFLREQSDLLENSTAVKHSVTKQVWGFVPWVLGELWVSARRKLLFAPKLLPSCYRVTLHAVLALDKEIPNRLLLIDFCTPQELFCDEKAETCPHEKQALKRENLNARGSVSVEIVKFQSFQPLTEFHKAEEKLRTWLGSQVSNGTLSTSITIEEQEEAEEIGESQEEVEPEEKKGAEELKKWIEDSMSNETFTAKNAMTEHGMFFSSLNPISDWDPVLRSEVVDLEVWQKAMFFPSHMPYTWDFLVFPFEAVQKEQESLMARKDMSLYRAPSQ